MIAGDKDILDRKYKTLLQYRELYPGLLTIALFAVFGCSVITGARLANEPNCKYWIGEIGYITLAIPLIVVIAHIVQSYNRRPSYFAVLFSCVLPPLLCLIVGFTYSDKIDNITVRLLSTDCTTFQHKFRIEQAYKSAKSFYDDCVAVEAKNHSKAIEVVKGDKIITQCPGYDPQASGYPREWTYLQALEEKEHCAGWCFVGEDALWTRNPRKWDSCSSAAGMTMKNAVGRNASRLMINGVVGFLIALLVVFAINEWMANSDDPSLKW